MRKRLLLTLPVLALALLSRAQPVSLDAATIPEALKKNANVVIRYDRTYFEITDIDKAYLTSHFIYTILNSSGSQYERFSIGYDNKFTFFEDAEIKVYDKNGRQINKYKKKDLMSHGGSGSDLIDDNKYSSIQIPAPSYPITIDISYEVRRKGSLFLPSFDIISPEQGVEQSSFIVKVPKDLDLRYKEQNIKLPPKVSEDEKYKTYEWSVSNLSAFAREEGCASAESLYPTIRLAANKFKWDQYEGDMTSWKNLGIWENNLHKGLDVLPEDRKVFYQNLVKDAKDDREKVRLIYDYLQQNFRYVSIQLGIGGWRSLPATFTDQKKYGDCKGLTNFMQAALKAVGIRSHAALINAGYNKLPVDPAFPMGSFNHVILCVPQPKDTIWLECTSKTNEFAVLGSFTENRNALLVTEEGGVLVKTPSSKSTDNKFDIYSTIAIQPDGSGKMVSLFKTTGEYKELMGRLFEEKKDDQKNYIINGLGFKQPDEFSLTQKHTATDMQSELEMSIEKIPEFIAGNKMFLATRLYKLAGYKLPKAENRTHDYFFDNPFRKTDTTIIQLPEGFLVEALPQAKDIKCAFATYQTKYWYDEAKKAVISTTAFTLDQYRIPATEYATVKKFFEEVNLDDSQRIVIKKQ